MQSPQNNHYTAPYSNATMHVGAREIILLCEAYVITDSVNEYLTQIIFLQRHKNIQQSNRDTSETMPRKVHYQMISFTTWYTVMYHIVFRGMLFINDNCDSQTKVKFKKSYLQPKPWIIMCRAKTMHKLLILTEFTYR